MLVCRSDRPFSDDLKAKIGGFCGVPTRAVIPALDADSIYAVPLALETEGLCRQVLDVFGLADHPSLLYNLSGHEGSLLPFHEAIAASIALFSDSVADAGGGLKGRQWYLELEWSKLLLRLYSQAEDDLEVRSQCLDSWDMLLRTGSLNPGDLLSRIDAS